MAEEGDKINRRYYELCALNELRGALRAGNVWIKNSRRYANPESYLIDKKQWEALRPEALRLLGLPQKGERRLEQRKTPHSIELSGKVTGIKFAKIANPSSMVKMTKPVPSYRLTPPLVPNQI